MKSYKQRYEEMNKFYLDRIKKLQDQLHAERIAREQIDSMYQGYVVEIIKKYGLPESTVFIEPKKIDLNTMILVEPMEDGKICIRAVEKPAGENKSE